MGFGLGAPSWLIFRTFFAFFAFVVGSLSHLRPKSLSETIFFNFGSIFTRFLKDLGTIFGQFFALSSKIMIFEKSRFALEKLILFKGRGCKILQKIVENFIKKQNVLGTG